MTGAWAYTIGAPALLPRDRRTDSSPSLISISARFDSSSNSMSFLSLRRSMDGLWWNTGVAESRSGGRRQAAQRCVERVTIAVCAEAADHAHRLVAEVAVLAEGFAGVRI